MRAIGITLFAIVFFLAAVAMPAAQEINVPDPQQDETAAIGRTPPRLSFVDGQTSFWRPGAEEWVQAQINTALAPGDQLFAGDTGNLELQIGARAFVRGGPNTQIGLESQEPDFLQFKVTTGSASFDLRNIEAGRMVAVDTPNAAFTIAVEGYYRLDVGETQTTFTTHRAGRATIITDKGETIPIDSNASVVIAADGSTITSQSALPLDSWDQWNYARTDQFLDSESVRYVSSEVYGLSDLDRYGVWRIVPTYGAVWTPRGVAAGWAPYSTGAWVRDPYYGWTWVDTAPWGWAPYHYGRWVYVNSYWCWAPGPRVIRPAYAPALVAFFGDPDVQISVGIGGPFVGWVSLGWGEPLIPWWGRPGFIHQPWWGGWRGPRFVNNKAIRHNTVVKVQDIKFYRNAKVKRGMVVIDRHDFGHGPIAKTHIVKANTQHLRPLHTAPHITASAAGFVPTMHRGIRPPEKHLKRSVVVFRRHNTAIKPAVGTAPNAGAGKRVKTTRQPIPVQMRPPAASGHGPGERPKIERPRAPRIESPKSAREPAHRPDVPSVKRHTPARQRPSQAVPGPREVSPSHSAISGAGQKKESVRHIEQRPAAPKPDMPPVPDRPQRPMEPTAPAPVVSPKPSDPSSGAARHSVNSWGTDGDERDAGFTPKRVEPGPSGRYERRNTETGGHQPRGSFPNGSHRGMRR